MGWGKLKPFWKSQAWKKSAKQKTGFFSWGDSNVANVLDRSGTLDRFIDQVTKSETARLSGSSKPNVSEDLAMLPIGSQLLQNKGLIMIVGALVAYKVFLK